MDWLIEHFVYPTLKIVAVFGVVLWWLLVILYFIGALKHALRHIFRED